jgi:4-amino-4-deoxy-L-arabinose transferase-like glycosyltransferase
MPTAIPASAYLRRALVLAGALLVLRLAYAALFATNPAGDEAYYWDWGRRLDYGYYSKPPGIAWLYAFVDRVLGGSLFAIRAVAALLGTGSLLLLFRLARDLFDARTAWYAVLLGALAPANAVLSYFLTIDAPLVVCWLAALLALWHWASGRGGRGTLALLCLALATGHLFKQMMMLFPLLAVIFLATGPGTRPLLRQPGIWAALLGSYLAVVPPLLWNARHGWITFRHTAHHFETAAAEGGPSGTGQAVVERIGDFLSFLGTQFGVLSPGTAFVVFSLCLVGLPGLVGATRNLRYLLVFGALPLAVMLLLALRQEMQPNWAAVYYLSGVVLAGAWYAGRIPAVFPPGAWRRLLPWTLAFGIGLSAYFYAAPPVFALLGQAGHKADPERRLLGHDRLAAEVEAARRALPEADSLFIATVGHRDLASHLAFGLPDRPRVYRWESRPGVHSQYEIWNDPAEDGFVGRDGLILVAGPKLPPKLAKGFASVEEAARFTVSHGRAGDREYSLYLGRGLAAWPKP